MILSAAYPELVNLVKVKADTEVPNVKIRGDSNKKSKRFKRKNVPYWNEEFENEWQVLCDIEKTWKVSKPNERREKQHKFNIACKIFDNDPVVFWKSIDQI